MLNRKSASPTNFSTKLISPTKKLFPTSPALPRRPKSIFRKFALNTLQFLDIHNLSTYSHYKKAMEMVFINGYCFPGGEKEKRELSIHFFNTLVKRLKLFDKSDDAYQHTLNEAVDIYKRITCSYLCPDYIHTQFNELKNIVGIKHGQKTLRQKHGV